MDESGRFYDAVLRQDLSSFIAKCFQTLNPATTYLPNWHIDLIAEYLQACMRGEIKRLVIAMPPRALKSVSVSVAWPAWVLGHNPSQRVMAASYAASLSVKHSVDCRHILQAPWYRALFPATVLTRDQNTKHKFMTTKHGFRFATSVGASAIGEGGDILIVDDPMNPVQALSSAAREQVFEWFRHSFLTRLNNKETGCVVVVMQRLHPDDLVGQLLESGVGGWEVLSLPAISEEDCAFRFGGVHYLRKAGEALHTAREGAARLRQLKQELGSHVFSAQYQQSPQRIEGALIMRHWFQHYDEVESEGVIRIVQSWDTAIKAGANHDASVCATWAEAVSGYYLLDMAVMRLEYPALKQAIVRLAERFRPHVVLLEDAGSGQSLLQDLRRESQLPLIGVRPHLDKVTRLAAVSALVESGRVWLPRRAAWLADFESELYSFPAGKHDDQVDAFSQYLNWVREKSRPRPELRRV